MLILFETPAGYALLRLLDEGLMQKPDKIWAQINESPAEKMELVSFKKFKDTADALESATAAQEARLPKALKKLLKKQLQQDEQLAVGDTKLASIIKEKLEVSCLSNTAVQELMRGVRANMDSYLEEWKSEMEAMRLGLAHSLARYRVKFNPEKIDTMIVQAVSLLDDLDKELNNYVMRCREWYGWHFPELGKIITDPQAYAKTVKIIGKKQDAQTADFSSVLPEDLVEKVRAEAEISMGTDISELDLINIQQLCDQIIELSEYRTQLHEYLKNRMFALAPNLSVLLGELVGARLISKAGSLVQLSKYPASTVQILGAEKALFRALKTKKSTPKYGIIYHAQLISQSGANIKGKIARKLANKVSLSARIDALCDESMGNESGIEARALLERVIVVEQERGPRNAYRGIMKPPQEAYTFKKQVYDYDKKVDISFSKKRPHETGFTPDKFGKKLKIEDDVKKEEVAVSVSVQPNEGEEEAEVPAKKKNKKKQKSTDNVQE